MKTKHIVLAATIGLLGLSACRTTEANYRAAYERAVANREAAAAQQREAEEQGYVGVATPGRPMRRTVTAAGDTVRYLTVAVAPVAAEDGGVAMMQAPYVVVMAEFKQLFNARSLRARLADAGFTGACIVADREDLQYVCAGAWPTIEEADSACRAIGLDDDLPLRLKPGFPYVLVNALQRR